MLHPVLNHMFMRFMDLTGFPRVCVTQGWEDGSHGARMDPLCDETARMGTGIPRGHTLKRQSPNKAGCGDRALYLTGR